MWNSNNYKSDKNKNVKLRGARKEKQGCFNDNKNNGNDDAVIERRLPPVRYSIK